MSQRIDPHKRPRQVADLIHRDLANILRRDTNDSRLNMISITEVDVPSDLGCARIYYTLHDKTELSNVKKALTKGTGFLRQRLADKVALRYIPKLIFIFDENLEKAGRLTGILNKIEINESEEEL